MASRQFSIGERVAWSDGDTKHRGTIVECDVPDTEGSGDRDRGCLYQINGDDESKHTIAESDLEPVDGPSEE